MAAAAFVRAHPAAILAVAAALFSIGYACVVQPRDPGPPSVFCCNYDDECLTDQGYVCVSHACLLPCTTPGQGCDVGGVCTLYDTSRYFCLPVDLGQLDFGTGSLTDDCIPFSGSGGFGGGAGGIGGSFGGFGGTG